MISAQTRSALVRPAGSGKRHAPPTGEDDFSTTDPQARLYRKGKSKETNPGSFIGHGLMENRRGLLVDPDGDKSAFVCGRG